MRKFGILVLLLSLSLLVSGCRQRGQWIAFVSDRDGSVEIYKMSADGTQLTNLTNSPANDGDPVWSP